MTNCFHSILKVIFQAHINHISISICMICVCVQKKALILRYLIEWQAMA